jgi:hypothetical protein
MTRARGLAGGQCQIVQFGSARINRVSLWWVMTSSRVVRYRSVRHRPTIRTLSSPASAHDIGYVRGVVKGDKEDGYVVDGTDRKISLPRGSSMSGRSCLC